MLARYAKDKPYQACIAVCQLFSYLSGTTTEGVQYGYEIKRTNGFESRLDLHGFSDADWESDLRTRQSTGGFVVYACGGPMSWGSRLMTTVAASSMESEYMGAFRLGQELLSVSNVGTVPNLPFTKKIPFFMDAMAASQSLKNPTCRARTKHISTKWFGFTNMLVCGLNCIISALVIWRQIC